MWSSLLKSLYLFSLRNLSCFRYNRFDEPRVAWSINHNTSKYGDQTGAGVEPGEKGKQRVKSLSKLICNMNSLLGDRPIP